MSDFLTTRELAALLRVKERKVYDLVAQGRLPVRRVTGKLLFARSEIVVWMGGDASAAGQRPAAEAALPDRSRPLIFVGGHDPLLEWSLRESGSGIAAFLDGAMDGLRRAEAGDCIAAGLHLPEGGDWPEGDHWNVATVAERFAHEPWVLVEWARRKRGLIVASRVAKTPKCLRDVRGLRFQARQPDAGSERVLDRLLARERMVRADLMFAPGIERTEIDLAHAVAKGRADVGLGIAAAARHFDLAFEPLIEERFDLLVWRRAWFDPPFQAFLNFCRSEPFRSRAEELGGYDVSRLGTVRFNGG